ncbi:MAG: hypothetical protein ACXVBU_15525 [Ktedonobacteraceae bacterium]
MSKQVTRQQIRQERRREEQRRREEERLRAAKAKRNFTIGAIVGGVLVLAIAVSVYFFFIAPGGNAQGQTSTNPSFPPVDSISCDNLEQTAIHYHVHVTIYINGSQVRIPQQVGIAPDGSCFYWMHTHDTTGVVHIEAPQGRNFTLGNFFHIWGGQFPQLQYPLQLEQSNGWQVYLDGQPYKGDFHNMVLKSHMVITLASQSPGIQPDTTYNWPSDLAQ